MTVKKARPGDVFEIGTSRGLAYAQITHRHKQYGHLVRVLPGLFPATPRDLGGLVSEPAAFATFFPLDAALRAGVVKAIGNYPIPRSAAGFPLFRTGVPNPATGEVETWWFWDGEREWRVGSISDEQQSMPIREILTLPTLVERIEDQEAKGGGSG